MRPTALILGAGLAGLSTAVHLANKGFEITILEKRPFAGGRTYSFSREFWPYGIDNGPHVMLGCYKALLELLDIVGGRNRLNPQSRLRVPYILPGSVRAALAANALPPPLHLLSGLMRFSLLGWREKMSLAKIFFKIRFMPEEDSLDHHTAYEWLNGHNQAGKTMEIFWRPLVLATLNEQPENVSFLQLFRVLKLGILGGKDESRLILIPEGLTSTLIEPALDWLAGNGARIELNCRIECIKWAEDEDKIIVQTNHGEYDGYDVVVSALPFRNLRLLTLDSGIDTSLETMEGFRGNAILNLHFWHPEQLISAPMACLQGIRSQWLFAQSRHGDLTHHTLVISSADELIFKESKQELAQSLLGELPELFPQFNPGEVKFHYIIIEKNATLVCKPGIEAARPLPGRLWKNLYLAGDWTRTGLPPTMESAVLSGRMAAEAVARDVN
jgi:zeta-carotene desaturase